MLNGVKAFPGFAVDDVPGGPEIRLGPGTRVMVYSKPDHTPAAFTILDLMVGNILSIIEE